MVNVTASLILVAILLLSGCTQRLPAQTTIPGGVTITGPSPTTPAYIRLREGANNGGNYYQIEVPSALAANVPWILPAANAAGQLTNDGAGNLSWAAGGGSSPPFAHGTSMMSADGSGSGIQHLYTAAGAGNTSPLMTYRKATGTVASPGAISDGQTLLYFDFQGYVSGAYSSLAAIFASADGSDGGRLHFRTYPGSGLVVDRWTIDKNGHFYPTTNVAHDMGRSGNAMRDVWTEDLYTQHLKPPGADIKFHSSLNPNSDNLYAIGSSPLRVSDVNAVQYSQGSNVRITSAGSGQFVDYYTGSTSALTINSSGAWAHSSGLLPSVSGLNFGGASSNRWQVGHFYDSIYVHSAYSAGVIRTQLSSAVLRLYDSGGGLGTEITNATVNVPSGYLVNSTTIFNSSRQWADTGGFVPAAAGTTTNGSASLPWSSMYTRGVMRVLDTSGVVRGEVNQDSLALYDSSGSQKFLANLYYLNLNDALGQIDINTTAVVKARKTGWTAATGTATRSGFATSTVTLEVLAQHVKALIDDLHGSTGHGLIGN